jgi:DNA-binding transcriptional ArsR family regulator
MSECNEVSIHEVLVWLALLRAEGWSTSREISRRLEGKVADRTVRAHLRKLAMLGLVDTAEVFPGHRYRVSEKSDKRNGAYTLRLREAASVFGLGEGGQ